MYDFALRSTATYSFVSLSWGAINFVLNGVNVTQRITEMRDTSEIKRMHKQRVSGVLPFTPPPNAGVRGYIREEL